MPTTPLREALQGVETEIAAGRPGEALRRCDQLLATHPRWLDAQRLRARALVALDRMAEAEGTLDTILASNPEDGDAFCDRAYLLQQRGEPLGALACYRRACELLRSNAGLRAAHNQLAARLGRPPYTPSHTGLARLYLRAELFAHAQREWDIALGANPNRLDAQIGMAETLWRVGDARRAQATCQYILQHMPLCLKPLLLLAFFELEAGRADAAQDLVNLAGELDPEQTVAGGLFGDLVAGGHVALAQLFRAAVRSKTSPLAVPSGSDSQTGTFAAVAPASQRPISEPLPTGQLATGPLFANSSSDFEALPTGKLSYPPPMGNGQGGVEDFFSQSRAAMLPDNFDKVFRETEYMLWSRDIEEPITAEIPVITAATPPPVPPAGGDRDFIRWLQEQGARPLDGAAAAPPIPGAPSGPAASAPRAAHDSAPVDVPPFLAQALAQGAASTSAPVPLGLERAEAPAIWDEDDPAAPALADEPPSASPSGALPLPATPEETAPPPIVPPPPFLMGAASAPPASPPEAPMDPPPTPISTPPPAAEASPSPRSEAQNRPPDHAVVQDEPIPPVETVPAEGRAASHNGSAPVMFTPPPASDAPPVSTPPPPSEPPATAGPVEEEARPLTMEAIQQGLESAGFARLETGRLAAVASSLNPTTEEAPAAVGNVGQQIETARSLRRNGRLGEALVEYRALVKAASDRMPDIIRDLRDAAIEAPGVAEVHRLLGDAFIREGDYVEALEAYNRASQLRQDEVGR